jgi:hypothetical protein
LCLKFCTVLCFVVVCRTVQDAAQMAEVPPVAGKRGEGDLKGDMVEGPNK